jgi:hypothetical protein
MPTNLHSIDFHITYPTYKPHRMLLQVAHPMEKLQRQVRSLVDKKLISSTDSLWKIALLYGDEWVFWKKELLSFEFSMQDPVSYLLAVESWDED